MAKVEVLGPLGAYSRPYPSRFLQIDRTTKPLVLICRYHVLKLGVSCHYAEGPNSAYLSLQVHCDDCARISLAGTLDS
jgi:hypothetical protein